MSTRCKDQQRFGISTLPKRGGSTLGCDMQHRNSFMGCVFSKHICLRKNSKLSTNILNLFVIYQEANISHFHKCKHYYKFFYVSSSLIL